MLKKSVDHLDCCVPVSITNWYSKNPSGTVLALIEICLLQIASTAILPEEKAIYLAMPPFPTGYLCSLFATCLSSCVFVNEQI